jgi:hypothetical protein
MTVTGYPEALKEAAAKMMEAAKPECFTANYLAVFKDIMPSRMERLVTELQDQPYVTSAPLAVQRINQIKWDSMSPSGYFGKDKEPARQEVGRLFDNFTVDTLKAQEQFRSRQEMLGRK